MITLKKPFKQQNTAVKHLFNIQRMKTDRKLKQLLVILICIWTIVMPISSSLLCTEQVHDLFYFSKVLLPTVIVFLSIYISLWNFTVDKITLYAGLFPLYAALMLLPAADIGLPVALVYFVWWWLMFYASRYIAPAINRNTLKFVFISIFLMEILTIGIGIAQGVIYHYTGGWMFGVNHPNFFGDVAATCTVLPLYLCLSAKGRRGKLIYLALTIANSVLLIGSRSISSILFVLCVFAFMWYKGKNRKIKTILVLLLVLLLIIVAGWLLMQSSDTLHYLSKGRLLVWQRNIAQNLHGVTDWVFGNAQMVVVGYPADAFDTGVLLPHIDNSYLELLIRYGFVGLALFLVPLLLKLKEFRVYRDIVNYGVSFAQGILFAVCVQGLFETIFPSLGNMANILIFLAMAILSDPVRWKTIVKTP